MRREAVQSEGAITRVAISADAAGESHLPLDGFFNIFELCGIGVGLAGGDEDGFFAGDVAGRLQSIDADVHQGSATRQGFVQSPLARIADGETEAGFDALQLFNNFFHFQITLLKWWTDMSCRNKWLHHVIAYRNINGSKRAQQLHFI